MHDISEDVVVWAENIAIDGRIDGDLIAGGYDIDFNGEIAGSENVMGYQFRHRGRVERSLRAVVNIANIDGYVGRSAILFGNQLSLGKTSLIESDVTMIGGRLLLEGTVRGPALLKGGFVRITGIIEGDVDIEAENIIIMPPAVIKGNLSYTCSKEAEIDLQSGVTIVGETVWTQPEKDSADGSAAYAESALRFARLLAAFIFGVILIGVFRRYAAEALYQLRSRFAVCLASGLISALVVLLSAVVLVVSSIAMILGYVLVRGDSALAGVVTLALSTLIVPIASFITVSGGVVFYAGKVVLATLLGFSLVSKLKAQPASLGKGQLFLGLLILSAAFAIPYLGFIIYLLVALVGGGAIVLGVKHGRSASREGMDSPPPKSPPPVEPPPPARQ